MTSAIATTSFAEPQRAQGAQRWYAAQVQPRKEQLALAHLRRQRFVSYCPIIKRIRRLRKQSLSTAEPLFPGYVFVALDCEREPWRSINGTIGVLRLVSFGLQPAVMPRGFIEQLQYLAGDDGHVQFDEVLRPGDGVRIVGGPFDGLCGSLASSGGRERVTVLLQILTGETKVTLPRSSLIAT
ncbi:MAG: transcription elongation factor/antiterminator RfaH [Parasphingorhabdus sp.]|jgi:transcription elongation factor/antiterminator RfaH|uniref:transcription termination/antitermination protein NusG n=1 Tax=Parasphingorhabdus sp. TaxID=2709688 RepID=UPI002B2715BE|nr:transcriptional activator RfaH [Parasphingorhabdus sp.]|tara:strand:- start:24751 stop:25299 length:549 start_codon:yes stop_codon:yes gene_type:complete